MPRDLDGTLGYGLPVSTGYGNQKLQSPNMYIKKEISVEEGVKKSKDIVLKTRLDTLIKQSGYTQRKFYKALEISRQLWYYYCWGLWEVPIPIKIKIAKLLDTDSSLIWQEDQE